MYYVKTEIDFSQFKFLKRIYICYCVLKGQGIIFVEKTNGQQAND